MQVSGFTIVRNAEILDYPFRESVLSILPFCDEFIINCGDSEDRTRNICKELQEKFPEKVRVIDSIWQRDAQRGGYQLKSQTDKALQECRYDWCFYVQADEVLHEDDLPRVREALQKVSKRPEIDGVLFNYVHFYGSYQYFIEGRNWYRREVRLFRNRRRIEAFRDAQGFRKSGKRLNAYPAEARVFHYGYVRDAQSYKKKSIQMSQWWGEAPVMDPNKLKPKRDVGIRRFQQTHPAVMQGRVQKSGIVFDPSKCERKWDWNQIKNAITLVWEGIFHFRIGEFRNYRVVR